MNLISFPLRPGDQGSAVAGLLDALDALGYGAAGAERDQYRLGPATQQSLRAFQKREQLDLTGEVDADTAARLNQRLDEAGLLSYRVSGLVAAPGQRPRAGQRVAAFDVDLRGAGRYAQAKTLGEVKETGGLEPLGEATTDAQGHYAIGFGYRQYAHAERGRADVVVYAYDPADGRIVGRSRLGLSADYSAAGELPGLDVALAADAPAGPTEWQRLSEAADPLLRESDLNWAALSETPDDQLAFLAQETNQPATRLAVRTQAARRAAEAAGPPANTPDFLARGQENQSWKLSEEYLYGLGRQNLTL